MNGTGNSTGSRVTGWSGRAGAAIGALARRQVLQNAASMFSTTAVTSLLGFVFWGVAARVSPATEVGAASAAISAMQLIGNLCTLGLSTLLIANLGSTTDRRPLITTCVAVATTVATIVSACYAVIYNLAFPGVGPLYGDLGGVALFAVGTGITSMTMVLDGALVGLLLGSRQLWRNFIYSIVKVLAVFAFAVTTGASAAGIYTAWLVGNVISLIALLWRTQEPTRWLATLPSWKPLRGLGKLAFGHHWVNVTTQTPRMVLPVLVATQLGNEVNAAFYAALLLAGIAWIAPNHISTAMFAVTAHDPSALRRELRTAMKFSIIISALAAVVIPVLSGPLLMLFGSGYDSAQACLAILGVATFAAAVKSLYIAVRRSQGVLGRAAWATTFGAILEVAGAEIGLLLGGLTGLALGLFAAMVVQAVFMWFPIRAVETGSAT